MSYRVLAVTSAIVCILVLGTVRAQAPPSQPLHVEPQFQIITATVDGIPDKNGHSPDEHTVFLIDLNTGRTWKFSQAAFAYHKDGSPTGPALGAYFEAVNVDGLRGWDAKLAINEWMKQQK